MFVGRNKHSECGVLSLDSVLCPHLEGQLGKCRSFVILTDSPVSVFYECTGPFDWLIGYRNFVEEQKCGDTIG